MELFKYYNLDECIDLKLVKKELNHLKKEGKIDYNIDGDILKIEDIDLDDNELEDIINLFEDNDIFQNMEYGEYEDYDYDDLKDDDEDDEW